MELITLINKEDPDDTDQFAFTRTDNVVYMKMKLADRINERAHDIQFIYRDLTPKLIELNNNDFIPQELYDNSIYYEISSEPAYDIILRIKRNYYGIPKFVQFPIVTNFCQIISEFKKLYHIEGRLFLFRENGSALEANLALNESGLCDYSKVKVWVGESLNVNITLLNPLKNEDDISTQFDGSFDFPVTETVVSLKAFIQNHKKKFQNLQLFTDKAFLDDDKQLLYYVPDKKCIIYCVDMVKRLDVTINNNDIIKGKYAEEFSGTINFPVKEKCVAYAYDCKLIDINKLKILKYEIVTRLMLPYGDEYPFVELLTMYTEPSKLYIVTENMPGGSLRSHLEPPLEASVIIKYCQQILKGLKIMHGMKIIHRNINCGSVLIDGNGVAKLTNFHLSKFLFDQSTDALLSGIKGSKIEDGVRFVAPEVHLCEPYGFKSDVWSFGATLIEMVTRQKPYPDISNVNAIDAISNNKTIVYERNCYPGTNFDAIIDMCIQPCQSNRPNAWDLFNLFSGY